MLTIAKFYQIDENKTLHELEVGSYSLRNDRFRLTLIINKNDPYAFSLPDTKDDNVRVDIDLKNFVVNINNQNIDFKSVFVQNDSDINIDIIRQSILAKITTEVVAGLYDIDWKTVTTRESIYLDFPIEKFDAGQPFTVNCELRIRNIWVDDVKDDTKKDASTMLDGAVVKDLLYDKLGDNVGVFFDSENFDDFIGDRRVRSSIEQLENPDMFALFLLFKRKNVVALKWRKNHGYVAKNGVSGPFLPRDLFETFLMIRKTPNKLTDLAVLRSSANNGDVSIQDIMEFVILPQYLNELRPDGSKSEATMIFDEKEIRTFLHRLFVFKKAAFDDIGATLKTVGYKINGLQRETLKSPISIQDTEDVVEQEQQIEEEQIEEDVEGENDDNIDLRQNVLIPAIDNDNNRSINQSPIPPTINDDDESEGINPNQEQEDIYHNEDELDVNERVPEYNDDDDVIQEDEDDENSEDTDDDDKLSEQPRELPSRLKNKNTKNNQPQNIARLTQDEYTKEDYYEQLSTDLQRMIQTRAAQPKFTTKQQETEDSANTELLSMQQFSKFEDEMKAYIKENTKDGEKLKNVQFCKWVETNLPNLNKQFKKYKINHTENRSVYLFVRGFFHKAAGFRFLFFVYSAEFKIEKGSLALPAAELAPLTAELLAVFVKSFFDIREKYVKETFKNIKDARDLSSKRVEHKIEIATYVPYYEQQFDAFTENFADTKDKNFAKAVVSAVVKNPPEVAEKKGEARQRTTGAGAAKRQQQTNEKKLEKQLAEAEKKKEKESALLRKKQEAEDLQKKRKADAEEMERKIAEEAERKEKDKKEKEARLLNLEYLPTFASEIQAVVVLGSSRKKLDASIVKVEENKKLDGDPTNAIMTAIGKKNLLLDANTSFFVAQKEESPRLSILGYRIDSKKFVLIDVVIYTSTPDADETYDVIISRKKIAADSESLLTMTMDELLTIMDQIGYDIFYVEEFTEYMDPLVVKYINMHKDKIQTYKKQ